MNRKIKILYVSAEISPYASAGGLGEVGRSYPKALVEVGNIEVRRVMPLYKEIKEKLNYLMDFPLAMGTKYETCILKTDRKNKEIPTYFIGNHGYFYRDNIYAYDDDGFRFFFFCKAVVEMLKVIGFKPDIVHTNDWHTGFLPLLLKKEFPSIKSVYTIHNISYHGFIPSSYLADLMTKVEMELLGYPEWLNFMKAGILYGDLITTVSPGYKNEVLIPEKSYGMSQLLKERLASFYGILNGIDTHVYNPKAEGVLAYPYDFRDWENKRKNRSVLRKEYGLPDTEVPLIAMVTRLEYAKGIDLVMKAISYLNLSTFQLIIMGSGNPYYHGIFESLSSGYSKNIVFEYKYTPDLAKKIYAAADIYLMPSQYEPCGLGQLYAMRYGAVPIVNPVGGLSDTVKDYREHPREMSGFYMEDWTQEALVNAIKRAIEAYYTSDWVKLIQNGMGYNASWSRSVAEYIRCYKELI